MNPSVQEAIGTLYIDKKVIGPVAGISYRLETPNNGNTRVLYQHSLADIHYSRLPKFINYQSTISDSMAMVTWYAVREHATFATLFTVAGSGKENVFNANTRQYIYKRKDTMFVTYSVRTIPGSKVVMFIRPEDNAGNRGISSDTVHLLALSFANSLTITHLTATDTLGSVWLTWGYAASQSLV